MIDDESGFSCAGLLGGLALFFALCCAFVISVNFTTGQPIVIDSKIMLQAVPELLEALRPLVYFAYILPVVTVLVIFAVGISRWLLRGAENAVTGLALALQDTRKKKRDEYDAYYDARLDEASYEPDANIAYYDNEEHAHLTDK